MEMKRQFHPNDMERLRHFQYMDDEFMTACFDGNIEAVELVLRIILDKPDLRVQSLQVQKVLKNLQGRSAILDVHAVDCAGTEYDIEIQRANDGAGVKRARHNSSLLDAHILKPGEEPQDMPESYVIFIAQNDVMKGNQPIYPVERFVTIGNEKVLFNDGSHILYVNGAYRGNDDIGKLMYDFSCENPDDMNFEELARKARYFKRDEEGRIEMTRLMEDLRNEMALETAERMIRKGKFSLEDIAECVPELSLEELKAIEAKVLQSV